MNKLWQFISRLYNDLSSARGYTNTLTTICSLISEHAEASVLIFEENNNKKHPAITHSQYEPLDQLLNNEKFTQHLSSVANVTIQPSINTPLNDLPSAPDNKKVLAIIVPIISGMESLGTLVLLRLREFSPEELVMGKAAGALLAASMLALKTERNALAIKDISAVRAALGTLSYSETEAAIEVLRRLPGNEGCIVASKVAQESKASRSAIVNALRKLESAGLVESHSMGVKGTYIKILTPALRNELKKR